MNPDTHFQDFVTFIKANEIHRLLRNKKKKPLKFHPNYKLIYFQGYISIRIIFNILCSWLCKNRNTNSWNVAKWDVCHIFFHFKWKHNYSLIAGDVYSSNVGGSN